MTVTALAASGCNLVGRVSVPHGGWAGSPSTDPSTQPAISGDGTVVAFTSSGSGLVAGDTNGQSDVFVRNVATDQTERVSLTSGGTQANGPSSEPALSSDGRFVVFTSSASDLVAGDTNAVADVFVRDRVAGTTERVSTSAAGAQLNGASTAAAISADGRFVAFTSAATDAVAGDTNGVTDVFVRDRQAGTTNRTSVTSGGAQLNGASNDAAISPSGDWLAYTTLASNAVSGDSNGTSDVILARRTGGTVRRASATDTLSRPFQQADGASSKPRVTDPLSGYAGSGEPLVAFQSKASNLSGADGNGAGSDVFVNTYVLGLSRTIRISAGSVEGTNAGIGVIDGGPRFVVTYQRGGAVSEVVSVESESPLSTASLTAHLVSHALDESPSNGSSTDPVVGHDGRFVAFASVAGNLGGRDLPPTASEIYLGRARRPVISSVTPPRVGLLETRNITIDGAGFEPGTSVLFNKGMVVNSVTYESPTRLVANVTATTAFPGEPFRTLGVVVPGLGGQSAGLGTTTCVGCVEIAAVVEQPGPVDVRITSADISLGSFPFSLPSCSGALCPALPTEVDADGQFVFGVDSFELTSISVPVTLAGFEVQVELVPAFVAPTGSVVPVTGAMDLDIGFKVGVRHSLLPANCALGPVQASLSTGPDAPAPAVAYDQADGTAVLSGGFTQSLSLSGCGLFTGALNTALGLPMEIGESSVVLGVQMDPVLTGTAEP